jgi:hypothetical protein
MSLYVANLMESAKPVSVLKKEKKVKTITPPESIEGETEVEKVVEEKKPRTEKQIAAFEKAKESRRLKKEALVEIENQKLKDQQDLVLKEKELADLKAQKLLAAKEKRLLKKTVSVPVLAEVVDEEPPKWFKKYMTSVKLEENMVKSDRQPVKKVKLDAQDCAHKEWQNGLTRDRVKNEVDGHMNRMYSQIFGR